MSVALTDLKQTAAEIWRWWTDELAGLVPTGISGLGSRGARVDIIVRRAETIVERVADGEGARYGDPHSIMELDEESWAQIGAFCETRDVRLLIEPPDIYVTKVRLLRQARRRARDAIELQLDDLSPIDPALLCWTLGGIEPAGDQLDVEVIMAKAARIASLQALFADRGLAVPPIAAMVGGKAQVLQRAQQRAGRYSRQLWVIALGLVASIPVTITLLAGLIAWADRRETARLDPEVSVKLMRERNARNVVEARLALSQIARDPSLAKILDDLAEHIPLDANVVAVTRLMGDRLMIEVDTADAEKVSIALASGRLYGFEQIDARPAAHGRIRVGYRGRAL